MPDVTITLDDYHRWIGELYARVRERDKALALLSPPPEPPVATPEESH